MGELVSGTAPRTRKALQPTWVHVCVAPPVAGQGTPGYVVNVVVPDRAWQLYVRKVPHKCCVPSCKSGYESRDVRAVSFKLTKDEVLL